MKRLMIVGLLSIVLPGAALAQRVPTVPPVPPTPVTPPVAPTPVTPAVPPARVVSPRAVTGQGAFDMRPLKLELDAMRFELDAERIKVDVQSAFERTFVFEQSAEANGVTIMAARSRQDAEYQTGLARLQEWRYPQAIEEFTKVIARKGDRTDAALYWKAFAEFKSAQGDQALASIAALRRDHTSSRYLADAKVLEADVKRLAGRPAAAAAADDDEIKLLAIQGLSRTGEAVPLLEGVLAASNSLGVKRRALYVLALSEDPKANDVLLRYAKGAGNPDLQIEAIRYLGQRSTALTSTELREIYESGADTRVKLAVIDAYRAKGDKVALIKLSGDLAKLKETDVRPALFSRMGGLVTADDVMAIYKQETDPAMRAQVLSYLGNVLTVDQLTTIARTDADASVRRRAISALGGRRTKRNSNSSGNSAGNNSTDAVAIDKALVGLYQGQQDRDVKRAVINALGNSADALVALARQETDVELKRDLVRRISAMAASSKAAADFLMEQLK